jgi:pimeloyl-ACP methyl ester carboxylesterase
MCLPPRPLSRIPPVLITIWFAASGWSASADEVHLKNGLILKGTVLPLSGLDARTTSHNNRTVAPIAQYWMIDDGVRRYFVTKRRTADILPEDTRLGLVSFQLKPHRTGGGRVPAVIGRYQKTEFDRHGHRVVTLTVERGADRVPEHISQSITLIRPDYLKVEATSHDWDHGLDASVLPAETLRAMIGDAIDPKKLADRQGVVMFYIQAELYKQAREELAAMEQEFPQQAAWIDEVRSRVANVDAIRALNEIRSRQEAGQHRLAYLVASKFPPDRVEADVLREAQDIVTAYDASRQKYDSAKALLGQLQAALPQEKAAEVAPLRDKVIGELHYENVVRLDPFLRSENDKTLTAAEKLALAYSAWVLGPGNAVTNLDDALRLWHARFLVLEFLRTNDNPARRKSLIEELQKTEGINVPRVEQMVPQLPLPIEVPPIPAGTVTPLEVRDEWDRAKQRYSIVLPPEYSPHHKYPLLVVLRAEGTTTEQELIWWAGLPDLDKQGPAQRRGYVAIAPEYAGEQQGTYAYNVEAHQAVLECINDVRRKFRIDSDRIYLAGHGMGADACFDMGMSHPGIFAGVVPIAGVSDRYCMYYRENAPDLAWYVVTGERDGNKNGLSLDSNARDLNPMMTHGQDIVYVEYKARGYETYFEETPRIFDWMALHRRSPEPAEWNVRIARHTDMRFRWLQMAGLPEALAQPVVWDPPSRRPQPREVSGKIVSSGNTIYVKEPAKEVTIWLSPRLVDFSARLQVHVKSKTAFNDFVAPNLEDLLEDLRVRGDRERLYWAKLTL